ncbi:MAG TPA: tRNA uridine-5-carboxymethylaminomethyl(34) synthesis GTPase MnmE [Candidatus Gastranaerophilaceae bacterium]|mgnify:CR=1 FL=1|nr:tRNA uridine-5-carboxymethylaminomethyl(34) synthesis GTPase MnmE [Candidatus Gastranaerophilaceae bacterium]HPT41563.1 tRNA uridine-5-carboxymethylaminomethyl(34) synthesis GTPase MnmE [Candidatus Gastranaerophilaceae bacterium]
MNILQEFDTIAAIATPIGTGGVGVIRISGGKCDLDSCDNPSSFVGESKCFEIVEKIFSGKKLIAGKIHHGWILDNDKRIDEVIVLPFKAPNSYTGEDVVEIQCHGGINVVRNILDLVLKQGARPAQRGEFTKRAFLNHKLDLSQAEAVCDLIHAKTQNFAIHSAKNLSGVLTQKIGEIKKDIFEVLSKILAGIDFPDDVKEPEYEYLQKEFQNALDKIESILSSAKSSNVLRQGIKIAILGKPNVGKSSLFNALLSMERAIVTDIAGTTRDILTETIDIEGIPVTLIDTAGIREHSTADKVEKIGIEFSKQSADEADLILFLYDASTGMNKDDEAILDLIKEKNHIKIANKADLYTDNYPSSVLWTSSPARGEEIIPSPLAGEGNFSMRDTSIRKMGEGSSIYLSTITQQGFDQLKQKIKQFAGKCSSEELEFTTNTRQQDCLERAKEALTNALAAAQKEELQDLISIDVKSALLSLDEITGEVITDDILNNIFENFCIGK